MVKDDTPVSHGQSEIDFQFDIQQTRMRVTQDLATNVSS